MRWKLKADGILGKTLEINQYPKLKADFREALYEIYGTMGGWKHFAKYDDVFSRYWDRSIGKHFREMIKYHSQFTPAEFRKKSDAIRNFVKAWNAGLDGNGEDRSVEFEKGLYTIQTYFIPEGDEDTPENSAIIPRRQPKRKYQNNHFDIER